jgi:cytochrome-b5 reductase
MMSEPVTCIKSKTPVPYELTAVHLDTHDTKTFCFALPDDATLDMLPGDFLMSTRQSTGKR